MSKTREPIDLEKARIGIGISITNIMAVNKALIEEVELLRAKIQKIQSRKVCK
jgi:hypothetical protein